MRDEQLEESAGIGHTQGASIIIILLCHLE